MNIERELNQFDQKIKRAESDLAKAEGSEETLMKRLKEEEEITSLMEASDILNKLDKKIDSLENDIVSKVESLKEIYG